MNEEELKPFTIIFQCSYRFSYNHTYTKEDQYISKASLW